MSSLILVFAALVGIILIQAVQFTSLFHARKAVLFAAQNDYELLDQQQQQASSSEHFLGLMMNNNEDKNSNHNQKLPCYKIPTSTVTANEKKPGVNDEKKKADEKNLLTTADDDTPSPLHNHHEAHYQMKNVKVPQNLDNLLAHKTAVVVLTYNRPFFLERTMKSIQRAFLNEQLDGDKFISMDGSDLETRRIIKEVATPTSGIKVLQHPHINPPGDLTATFSLAAHYRYVFDEIFKKRKYENLIIFEDDMDVGFDVFTFFNAMEPVLHKDPTVWCVSSWNDNAFEPPFDLSYQKVFRTSYFPGLGWMLKRSLWVDELSLTWPKDNWDHWMRVSTTHKQRSCIVPFVSRNFNFGKEGSTANEDFFNKYLSKVKTTGAVKEIKSWGVAEKEEMIKKFYVEPADRRKKKLLKNKTDQREQEEEVMGISSLTYNFEENNNVNADFIIKQIKSESEYDEWIQKEISIAEPITDASRILRIPSYAVAGTSNKPFVLPYKSEDYESLIVSKLHSAIHPFPRTHYKFVTWFSVATASSGYVKDVFLIDKRLSPFALDSFKINPDESLEPVVARSTGVSCTQTCADHHGSNTDERNIVYKCDASQFDFVNSCDVLRDFFKDCACQQGWGEDIPNMEATSIHHPPPANCLVTEMKPTCDASHPLTTRLCPCVRA